MTTLIAPTDLAASASPHVPAVRTTEATCAHCGLPVPRGLLRPENAEQFCCAGCRTASDLIRSCGLDRFYALRGTFDAAAQPARSSGRDFAVYDDPAFQSRLGVVASERAATVELFVEGVHCAACVWLIERLPRLAPGVVEARLDLGRQIVRVTWDPSRTSLSHVARRLDGIGYTPHPARGSSEREARRLDDRRRLVRIAVAGAIAGNVMVISFALYGGMFHGMEPEFHALFRFATLGLASVSVVWPGREFFRGLFAALRARTPTMDVPIAIGLAAGMAAGAVNTLRGVGEVYFDSIAVLVFLLLCGRFVQSRRQRAGTDAVEAMLALAPAAARRVDADGIVRETAIANILRGDRLEVRAGEAFPTDGVVVEGASAVDRAILTGESHSIRVGSGDEVHAGTTNLSARIVIETRETGESTRLGRLSRMVADHAANRPHAVRLADRVAGIFIVVVLIVAAAGAAAWAFIDPSRSVECALTLLIVTCPCALGMATPLTVTSAIGQAARRGILIKGGDVLERLARPGLVVLDKTGTITEGDMKVVDWAGEAALRPVVAAVERHSAHPVARALARLDSDRADVSCVTDVRETSARGIEAIVGGRRLRIGSRSFIAEGGASIDPEFDFAAASFAFRALSPMYVATDGAARAVAGVGDPVRADSRRSIDRLRRMGWRVMILSGDRTDVVNEVAATLGLDVRTCMGDAPPERKAAIVRELAATQTVLMAGDGVNDAAALASATVGVAVHGGAEASLEAAHAFTTRPGLEPIVELIEGSRRAMRVMRRGIAASIGYNLIATALALPCLINPLIAAVMMPLSSITVVTMAFRSRMFGDSR